jgi:hypothetical protein
VVRSTLRVLANSSSVSETMLRGIEEHSVPCRFRIDWHSGTRRPAGRELVLGKCHPVRHEALVAKDPRIAYCQWLSSAPRIKR